MKLGFMTAILADQTLEEIASFASSQGFEALEVMCWPPSQAERRYSGITHIDISQLDPHRVDEIRGLMDHHDLTISGLGYYPNPLDPDPQMGNAAAEHLARLIDAATLLDVPVVNTFIGRDPTKSIDDNWPRFEAVFKPLVARAADQGRKLAIENCPMLFTEDEWPGGKNLAHAPDVWRRMFETIPDPAFGLNYDPSHMIWQHMDPIAPLRQFADRIHHVHAKDVRLDVERLNEVGILATPNRYHTPKLPGLGDVDWGRFCGTLADNGYRGAICIEVEDRAYEGDLVLRQAALAQSGRYLRTLLPGRLG